MSQGTSSVFSWAADRNNFSLNISSNSSVVIGGSTGVFWLGFWSVMAVFFSSAIVCTCGGMFFLANRFTATAWCLSKNPISGSAGHDPIPATAAASAANFHQLSTAYLITAGAWSARYFPSVLNCPLLFLVCGC